MTSSLNQLYQKIEEYKNKYYKNQLIKGLLIGVALVVSVFIVVNFIEYFGRLNSVLRATLLFAFIGVTIFTITNFLVRPLIYFFKLRNGVSNQEAASDIGKFFPEIGDKLINTLQLGSAADVQQNALLAASIEQKSQNLKLYKFSDAINISENKKYLKYSIPPLLLLLLISAFSPNFFKSSERILKFNQEFIEEAPFTFEVENKSLKTYRNEDFTLNLHIKGDVLPEEVYLTYNDRRYKMEPDLESKGRKYSYTFNKLQENIDFNFLASGYKSEAYEISILNRPQLLSFDVIATYPSYLGMKPEKLENVGNLMIPEGTQLRWIFSTQYTDSVSMKFGENNYFKTTQNSNNEYVISKKLLQSSDYQIIMRNNQVKSNEKINYYLNVVKDQNPQIQLEQLKDTVLYNYIALGGTIADDYGISDFKLKYRAKSNKETAFKAVNIAFKKDQSSQSFFHQFDLRSLGLERNQEIEYYLEVWDNDGVNGHKSAKTATMYFGMPTSQEFDQEVDKQIEQTEDKMDDLLQKSRELKKALETVQKDLKTKKELDFNDKKKLEDLLKKKEELMKSLQELQKQFQQMQEKQNRFQEQSPETQEKMQQLQQMLQQLMDEENKELFKQMEEMVKEENTEKVLDQLQKMQQKERNLDREIERTMKLFKNMQLKAKTEELVKELEKLADKQEKLAEETEKNNDAKKNDELTKEQEKLNKEFDEKKEKSEDLEKLSKELRKEMDMEKQEQENVDKEQDKAKEQLDQNKNQDAAKSQKKAAKSMRNMANSMSSQMQSAEMKELDIDMDALRDILENLVKLSFEQERVMTNIRNISRTDPRFIELSQLQLKLVDDAKVIEDSLYSLAERVMQIESIVTKEVTDMKNSMDQSIQLLRDREIPKAAAKQQFSMTSMNNLALMLSDTFKQMQDMMAMSMPGSGKGGQKGSSPSPGVGDQMKSINDKLEGIGQGGKPGSELSKELAKIANEQAKLRKQIKEMQDGLNGQEGGKELGDKLKKIEQDLDRSETEIINKRVNPELVKRQRQIETRLLEAEKAIRERELDPKRKSKTAINYTRTSPPELEKFKNEKLKQLELIRTTPPNFTPFYKRETDNYFRKIK